MEFDSASDAETFLAMLRQRKHRENGKLQRAADAYGIPLDAMGLEKKVVRTDPHPLPTEFPARITIYLGDPIVRASKAFKIISIEE